jgi:hypothetical protein
MQTDVVVGPTLMQRASFEFRPIDLVAHAAVCVAFRRDSFICSFGVDNFFDRAGPNGEQYIERLELRMAKFPAGYVHVWYEANHAVLQSLRRAGRSVEREPDERTRHGVLPKAGLAGSRGTTAS